MAKRRVLIAHQSTIPHYRVPFYEAVNQLKPSWWEFGVVFDANPKRRARVFVEPLDPRKFGFQTVPTETFFLKVFGRRVLFQTFVLRAGRFDLIVLEDALNNLSYPLARFWRVTGTSVAYWGHGEDRSVEQSSGWKRKAEALKHRWARACEGYFAYTPGVRDRLIECGVDYSRIHVLENTIDIVAERIVFEALIEKRERLRQAVGLADRKILLFVGRLTEGKQLGFLGEAIRGLRETRPEYHLVVIGGGDQSIVDNLERLLGKDGITCCGVIHENPRLGEWYVRSDAYVFPGNVGLGVVQSLCYDLTPVVVDRSSHNPEFEYLNSDNSVIVRAGASSADYGSEIHKLCSDRTSWTRLRAQAWSSIRHLTIENMARHFVDGVNQILRRQ